MCEDGVLPLVFGMWLPNILFLALTVLIFRRVNRERPLVPEPVQRMLLAFYDRALKTAWQGVVAQARRLLDRFAGRKP